MPLPQPPQNRMGRMAGGDVPRPERRFQMPTGQPPMVPGGVPGQAVRQGGPAEFRGNVGRAHGGLYGGYGPEQLAGQTDLLYQLLAGSPAFAGVLKGAAAQGQNAATAVASRLGNTGLSSSGVGAATGGLAQQLPAAAMQQARGDLFGQSISAAMQNLMARLQALPGLAQLFYQF